MDVNALHDSWIELGQKYSEAQNKIQMALNDDAVDLEAMKSLKAKAEALKMKRDVAKEQYDSAVAEGARRANKEKSIQVNEKSPTDKFVVNLKDLIRGREMTFKDLVISSPDGNDEGLGLTIPPDIQVQVYNLVRQYDALEKYVDRIPVTLKTGSRNLEKWKDITPFVDLDDETATIPANDDPNVQKITYNIHRHAGISSLSNTLLKDSPENVVAYIEQWLAKKEVVTRNQKILALLGTLPSAQKVTLAKFDDLKDVFNTMIDPALHATTMYFTNQSGFNVLDKVKTATGAYLLQKKVCCDSEHPAMPNGQLCEVPMINGRQVVIISDRWLPNGGTEQAPVFPLYIGDMKETVKLFDREQLSLTATNIGGGAFETDQTKIRAIDRFDTQLWDTEAMISATFTGIADQVGHFVTSQDTTSTTTA